MRLFRDEAQRNAVCKLFLDFVGWDWAWANDGPTQRAREMHYGKNLTREETRDQSTAERLAWEVYRARSPVRFLGSRARHSSAFVELVDLLRVATFGGHEAIDGWIVFANAELNKKHYLQGSIPEPTQCWHCRMARAEAPLHSSLDGRCWGCRRRAVRDEGRQIEFAYATATRKSAPGDLIDSLHGAAEELEFVFERWNDLVPQHATHIAVLVARAEIAIARFEDWTRGRELTIRASAEEREKDRHISRKVSPRDDRWWIAGAAAAALFLELGFALCAWLVR